MKSKETLWKGDEMRHLLKAFLSMRTGTDVKRFLRDLMTETELNEFAQRWHVARMLANNVPYTVIERETGMSSTTIARVHKWLKKGEGGYRMMINRLRR